MTKLSIIIPLYNHGNDICRCLNSLIKLNLSDTEIIVVDDGSTDNSLKICKDYQEIYPFISVYSKTNGGVSSARNYGIQKSEGKYILFCDPDDFVSEDVNFNDIIKTMIDKNYDLMVLNYNVIKNGESNLNKNFPKDNFEITQRKEIDYYRFTILNGNVNYYNLDYFNGCSFAWGKIYKKEIIVNNNIYFNEDVFFAEDFLFNFKYSEFIRSICIMNIPFYNYSVYATNTTLKYKENLIENYDVINNELELLLNNKSNMFIELYWSRLIRNLSTICKYTIFHKENKNHKKSIKELLNEKKQYKLAIKNVKLKYLTFKQKFFVVLLRLKLYFVIKKLV